MSDQQPDLERFLAHRSPIYQWTLGDALSQIEHDDQHSPVEMEAVLELLERPDPDLTARVRVLLDQVAGEHDESLAEEFTDASQKAFDALLKVATSTETLPELGSYPDYANNGRRMSTSLFTWTMQDLIKHRRDYAKTGAPGEEHQVECLERFLHDLPADLQPEVDQHIRDAVAGHRHEIEMAFTRLANDIYQHLAPMADQHKLLTKHV